MAAPFDDILEITRRLEPRAERVNLARERVRQFKADLDRETSTRLRQWGTKQFERLRSELDTARKKPATAPDMKLIFAEALEELVAKIN
jgi:hypothetical protein